MKEGSQIQPVCSSCGAPLIEIDRYGDRLEGCLQCNRWKWRGSERVLAHPLRGAAKQARKLMKSGELTSQEVANFLKVSRRTLFRGLRAAQG